VVEIDIHWQNTIIPILSQRRATPGEFQSSGSPSASVSESWFFIITVRDVRCFVFSVVDKRKL
jgi:hypothetical protein